MALDLAARLVAVEPGELLADDGKEREEDDERQRQEEGAKPRANVGTKRAEHGEHRQRLLQRVELGQLRIEKIDSG